MEIKTMKNKSAFVAIVSALVLGMAVTVSAQVNRPYHDGSVWQISFIQIKPGMDTAYLSYLATEWKLNQEALKKDGQILSYRVISTEGHSGTDFNLLLMTEYKNLATMEANRPKADALAQTVVGSDEKQMQGYRERLAIREVLGTRLAREIVLAPK